MITSITWRARAFIGRLRPARQRRFTILPGRCGSRFTSAIYWLRTSALDRIERLYAGNLYETGMMQAILIGEPAKLERAWTEQFRSTGTFHALVISGAHIAVIAAFLMFLLRICFLPRSAG